MPALVTRASASWRGSISISFKHEKKHLSKRRDRIGALGVLSVVESASAKQGSSTSAVPLHQKGVYVCDDGVYYYIGERLKLEGETDCSHWRGHSTMMCTLSSVYPQHQVGI